MLGREPQRDCGLPWDAERVGLATLAVVVIVFGVHSAIDWTWFVPGNAVPALLCAGWVASRMTLRERSGAGGRAAAASRRSTRRTVPRGARAALVLVIARDVAAWSALQPVRAVHAHDAAQARFERGELGPAASIARIAHDRNPLSVDPLFQLAAIERRRRQPRAALARSSEADRARAGEPGDLAPARPPAAGQLDDPQGALRAFQAAYYLDPRPRRASTDIVVTARTSRASAGR